MDPQNHPYQQDHEHPQHPYALPYAQHLHEHSQQQPHEPATHQLHHPHMTRVPAGLPQANRTDFLHSFWTEQMTIAERFESDFKVHPLPLARIKKVMKSDTDVKQMISAEAPMLFSKACEIFITELTLRAWMHAEENKRRTLQRSDVASAVGKSDQFDFLIDIVPREEQGKVKRHKEDEMVYDQASYYYSPTGQPYAAHGDPSAYYHQMQQIQQYHQYAQQQQAGGGYPSQPGYPLGTPQSAQNQYHKQSPNMTASRPPHQYGGDRASQYDGDRTSQYDGERTSQYEGQRAEGEKMSQYEGERSSQYGEERTSQYEGERPSQFGEERTTQYEGGRPSQYGEEGTSQYEGDRVSQYVGERPPQS